MSWWDSAASVERVAGWVNWSVATFGFFAAVAGLCAIVLSARANSLKSIEDAKRAAEQEEYRQRVLAAEAQLLESEAKQANAERRLAEVQAQAQAAEARANRAEDEAVEARRRADRYLPRPIASALKERVRKALSLWSASRERIAAIDFKWIGAGTPPIEQVVPELLELFRSAKVPLGNTFAVGIAGGAPHGALLMTPQSGKADADRLALALSPLIRNLEVRVVEGGPVSLLLNGTLSFEPDGSFSVE